MKVTLLLGSVLAFSRGVQSFAVPASARAIHLAQTRKPLVTKATLSPLQSAPESSVCPVQIAFLRALSFVCGAAFTIAFNQNKGEHFTHF